LAVWASQVDKAEARLKRVRVGVPERFEARTA